MLLALISTISISSGQPITAADKVQNAPQELVATQKGAEIDKTAKTAPMTTGELVRLYAEAYGVKEASMLATLKCESEFEHDALGDGGLAYGIAQFHEETFNEFKELAGLPDLDYRSKDDQIKLMAWAFANDYAGHWSCWRKYKAKKLATR